MSQFDEAYVFMPLEQAQLFFGRDTSVDVIEMKVDDPDDAKTLKPAVEAARARFAGHRLDGLEPQPSGAR
jgi:lipoprotein-releasing system permease protein